MLEEVYNLIVDHNNTLFRAFFKGLIRIVGFVCGGERLINWEEYVIFCSRNSCFLY